MDFESPRNVRIQGQRTSMRLEGKFWAALAEIAATTGVTVPTLCERILRSAHRGNRTSAIRVYVLEWFRQLRLKRNRRRGPRR
ncbi:MAG: ribbon-helix-helix domain-containing protein [Proteobacteria bacterium]|nr:ribbon-helix-helix domain-containing protein [Pseudomonadota bacterium]